MQKCILLSTISKRSQAYQKDKIKDVVLKKQMFGLTCHPELG